MTTAQCPIAVVFFVFAVLSMRLANATSIPAESIFPVNWVGLKLAPAEALFGLYNGDIDVRLGKSLGLTFNGGYYNNLYGLSWKTDWEKGNQYYFGGAGLKWFFTGDFLQDGFYLTSRVLLNSKNSSAKSELIVIPSALLGYQHVFKTGFVIDAFLGCNLWITGGKFGLMPLPTAGILMGWAV